MSTTQNTITKKQENKGRRGILDLTGQISQVLKQFEGIYTKKLPETGGLTVEGWMSAHGVERFVTPKGAKKGYTPALVMAGWHDEMKADKTAYVFKNVAAKFAIPCEEAGAWGYQAAKSFRVFTKEEAEKEDGKPISRYMLVPVAPNKWSVDTILKGLIQGAEFEKHEEKMILSDCEWAKLEKVYIVRYDKVDGQVVRRIIEVQKSAVEF